MDNNQNSVNNNSSGGSNGNGSGNNPKQSRNQNIVLVLVALLFTLFIMSYFLNMSSTAESSEISYTEFVNMLEDGKVESVEIQSSQIDITLKDGADKTDGTAVSSDSSSALASSSSDTASSQSALDNQSAKELQSLFGQSVTVSQAKTYYTGIAESDDSLTQRCLDAGVDVKSTIPDNSGMIISFLVSYILPIVLLWVLLGFVFRRMSKGGGGSPFNVGKTNAKVYVQKETGVTFKDVAGEDEAKESLVEVVDFLHNPGRYVKIGAKLPKGALLVGPPGTGKTLLAKAVAGEAHVPFYSLAGSDFIELYVGVGASRVRDLFKEAAKNAPCIIFIDEIDAIGRSRDNKYGGNEEREQTLNQLLSEMDGFDSSKGVLILGATNRPEILDKALLRPGRFDRRIIVDKPDLKGRVAILKVHSKDVKMDESVDLDEIALATSGAVGSDLANMINEAAINAVKSHRECVCQKDLMEAVEQVLVGKEKKDRILSKEERKLVSYHEVGHALISAYQKNTEPVQKITIVPRTMGALGYVMQVPEDEKFLQTKDELYDEIVSLLGGRAAEELIFNTVTTGAENDIEKATSVARQMITAFGMSDKFGLMQLESVQNRYLDGRRELNCSDETAARVDEEVMKLLNECYEKAKVIISEHLDAMDRLAQFLIERETITGKEFMKIYREVENIPEPTDEEKKNGSTRIWAKRPESAAVGEDVPDKRAQAEKEKEEELKPQEEKKDSVDSSWPFDSGNGFGGSGTDGSSDNDDSTDEKMVINGSAKNNSYDGSTKTDFVLPNDDSAPDRDKYGFEKTNDQGSGDSDTKSGRFSHVDNDFDSKNE